MLSRALTELPVAQVGDEVCAAVAAGGAVLTAPPGSGKTTLIPLLLRRLLAPGQRILVVTPRQVAARAAARRMAALLGESLGEQVGYQVRWDRQVGRDTKIVVMTEGVLLRRLADDPELAEVRCVVLDEFHERGLDADMLLGMLLDVRDSLRSDLSLLVMSATMHAASVAELLGDVATITAQGRMFPVTTQYRSLTASPLKDARAFADGVAASVRTALEGGEGDALVFLPGMREIRAVAARLAAEQAEVHILHSQVRPEDQDAAIAPSKRRKIILATPIAQTSLTVEGVRIVVDSGWHRVARFDAGAGWDRLVTERISRATAEQRAGRAGRVEEGHCVRLWSEDQQARLPAFDEPEILRADLAHFVLRAECWGRGMSQSLPLMDRPPDIALKRANELLHRLGALDAHGLVTAFGHSVNTLPLEVRTAAMLLRADQQGETESALWLATLLESQERSNAGVEADLQRLASLPANAAAWRILRDLARAMRCQPPKALPPVEVEHIGRLLALAFPERVARRRAADSNRFLCADGGEVEIDPALVGASSWAAVGHWRPGASRQALIAAPLDGSDVAAGRCGALEAHEHVGWDEEREAVLAEHRTQLGALTVSARPLSQVPMEQCAQLLCRAVARKGIACLPWTEGARRLQARIGSLRAWRGEDWPAVDDTVLETQIGTWLPPWLAGMSRLSEIDAIDMETVLRSWLDPGQLAALDALAPAAIQVPSGHTVALEYSGDAEPPVLAVKLQALFGMRENPTVNAGDVVVRVHLLSPAGRPLQVTQDLASFWQNGYPEVARELRGRYPKHPWPQDPLQAQASMQTKRRGAS